MAAATTTSSTYDNNILDGDGYNTMYSELLDYDEIIDHYDNNDDNDDGDDMDWSKFDIDINNSYENQNVAGDASSSPSASYHTLTPTLEILINWTLDYVDAVDLAGGITRVSVGVQNLLDDDYVFCSPTIGPINKRDFIDLMASYTQAGLDLASAIPDLTVSYDGWHVDPHNPWRIWAVARYKGTHTGSATIPNTGGLELIPPPINGQPQQFVTGPELQSFVWTPSKTLIWQTVGYVGDKYTGSNQGHGSLDGLLVSMGLPPLLLETTEPLRNLQGFLSQFIQSGQENSMKVRSSYSNLPYWWHQRKSDENNYNIHR